MTLLDHERWGIPYSVNEQTAATALLTKFAVYDKAVIGEQ
jgi:hypothetical protein